MTNKNRLEDDDDICSVVILDALSAKNIPSDPYSQINIKAYFFFLNFQIKIKPEM